VETVSFIRNPLLYIATEVRKMASEFRDMVEKALEFLFGRREPTQRSFSEMERDNLFRELGIETY